MEEEASEDIELKFDGSLIFIKNLKIKTIKEDNVDDNN